MKKCVALILAALLMISVAACGDKTPAATSPEPTNASTAATAAPAETDSATTDAAPATSATSAEAGTTTGLAGYWEDDVDPFAREKYSICYAMPAQSVMHENFIAAMKKFESILNFEILSTSAESNTDTYINNLYIMASKDIDGFLIDAEQTINERTKEVLNELAIPYVAFITILLDDDDLVNAPAVILDGYDCGQKMGEWFCNNYQSYWGDIDPNDIAIVDLTMPSAIDLHPRALGALDTFKKYFPDGTNQYYEVDMVNQQFTAEGAYDALSPVLTTHPEVKYWWIIAIMDFALGQGSARLVDALGYQDKAIVTSIGLDVSQTDWENGYTGPWISLGISPYATTIPAIVGVIALIDGRTTEDTLWKELARPNDKYGNKYGIWYIETQMVTYETFRAYLDGIIDKYGLEV